MEQEFSDYIIFVDESGDHSLTSINPEYPIFVLVFVIFHKENYSDKIQPAFKKLKFEFFGHDMVVLHAHDIRKPKGEFSFLLNPQKREKFISRINGVITEAEFATIVHGIDKNKLIMKYTKPFDPYKIALRFCLEQSSLFLTEKKQLNKLTHVIVESRGKKEDADLELEFRRIIDPKYDWGLASKFNINQTPFELKFVEKKINSAGLQLADLVAQPIGRHIINSTQENRAFDIIQPKIWRSVFKFP